MVLLHDGAQGCSVLLRALSSRGLSVVVVNDEPSAMVQLSEWSKRGLSRRILIVVEPLRWERVGELAFAVRLHHGSVCCWQFDVQEGAELMLSVLDPALGRGERSVVGKIRHRRRSVDEVLVQAPGGELSARGVVTQQELTMLLGPASGEAG